jgi:site-specific DNA recombinase
LGRGGRKQVSLLIGQVFDETGDRLTPSHTKSSKGHQLRYYVSHRLIRSKGPKDPSGWRLPGPELEDLVVNLIRKHLGTPAVLSRIVEDATTEETALIVTRLTDITANGADRNDDRNMVVLNLVQSIKVAPGKITISILNNGLADLLDVDASRIADEHLEVESTFRLRKRGVETKLVLDGAPGQRDETLIKNIAKAHQYFNLIRAGKTYAEIAASEGVSKHRIQKLVDLAFVAPDVVCDVFAGVQPTRLTSEWLLRNAVPAIWTEQRDMFRSM